MKDENNKEVVGGSIVAVKKSPKVGPGTQQHTSTASAAGNGQDATSALVMETFLNWKPLPKVQKGLLEMLLKQEGPVKASRDLKKIRKLCLPKSSVLSTL